MSRGFRLLGSFLAVVLLGSIRASASPVLTHPRIWLTQADLPRLRSWAASSNPIYQNGLAALAARAVSDYNTVFFPPDGLDSRPPASPWPDNGGPGEYQNYPTESYAALFGFMSLIAPDQATKDDYARRARRLLMYVMNIAVQGVAPRVNGVPVAFRDGAFAVDNRSRWWGEGFPLAVDWIYPYLSSSDKSTIRTVFLRWCDENVNATLTDWNHPQPLGALNDPALITDLPGRPGTGVLRIRWSANNHYESHMRQIGFMALSFDATDDPSNTLRDYLGNATGAWLYVIDYMLRNDGRGGLGMEGNEYSPQALGYVMQFLLALHTSGYDDPNILVGGQMQPQVAVSNNPFWNALVPGFLHTLSPGTIAAPQGTDVAGQTIFQPAWYGDGQSYWAAEVDLQMGLFGALGLYDYSTGNTSRLQAIRWIETNVPPGGASTLINRITGPYDISYSLFYFMLFDPAASAPPDPRPALVTTFFSPGINRILARTDWSTDASWFTYRLTWNEVDHQNCDGNQFELYRKGEWLTKEHTGYDLDDGSSTYHNTLTLQNDPDPRCTPGVVDYRCTENLLGSQIGHVSSGDPQLVAYRLAPDFIYASGDATNLYNSAYEGTTDILYANRSILWLKPDFIFIYDRAASQTANRFKRFWLNLPANATVSSNLATMTTASGQKLFVTTLLPAVPAAATITAEPQPALLAGYAAQGDPMNYRLRVDVTGGPASTRFLHVLQGADASTSVSSATLIQSSSGTAYAGALVNGTAVLFPVDLGGAFAGLTYTVPATTTLHLITGLAPNGSYTISTQTVGGNIQVMVSAGGSSSADGGGVIRIGGVGLAAPDGFYAAATSTTAVDLAWNGVTGASGYEIFRSTGYSAYSSLKTVAGISTSDTGLTADTTYVYEVRALGSGSPSAFSALDAATTTIFTDDPVAVGGTIKAVHITQLQTAVNAMRAAGGLGAASYTNTVAPGTLIRRTDITETRSALDAARTAIGLTPLTYTDPTIIAGTTIMKSAHIQELRTGVK